MFYFKKKKTHYLWTLTQLKQNIQLTKTIFSRLLSIKENSNKCFNLEHQFESRSASLSGRFEQMPSKFSSNLKIL